MTNIDIGNVRGIRGEKGDKGDKGDEGKTPSYDDLRYRKQKGEFITLKGTGTITQSEYYLDKNGNVCDNEGYIYEDGTITENVGEPFDVIEYGYDYKPLWIDENGKFTNSNGELLDENWDVQYVQSDFISDIVSFIYNNSEGFAELVNSVSIPVFDAIMSIDPNDESHSNFFDKLEGDVKYYICEDNPRTTIYVNGNDELVNECKYRDANGEIAKDSNNNYLYVPLEKNALYLHNSHAYDSNATMMYDIYLCIEADTVPQKLVNSADFSVNYNVIDDLRVRVTNPNNDDERKIHLDVLTRGGRGQFYSMDDVDTLFYNNLINKLGANNGIAQLNNAGKIPSSQLAFNTDLFTITHDKGTASANTTDRIYLEFDDSNDSVGAYYTQKDNDNNMYTWIEIDENILDNISLEWADIINPPFIPYDLIDMRDESHILDSKADVDDFDTLEVTINYADNSSETVEFYIVPPQP